MSGNTKVRMTTRLTKATAGLLARARSDQTKREAFLSRDISVSVSDQPEGMLQNCFANAPHLAQNIMSNPNRIPPETSDQGRRGGLGCFKGEPSRCATPPCHQCCHAILSNRATMPCHQLVQGDNGRLECRAKACQAPPSHGRVCAGWPPCGVWSHDLQCRFRWQDSSYWSWQPVTKFSSRLSL